MEAMIPLALDVVVVAGAEVVGWTQFSPSRHGLS